MIRFRLHLIVAAASLLAACAAPDVDGDIATAAGSTATSQITGAAGPLSHSDSKALLAKVNVQGAGNRSLARHLVIEEAVAGAPLTADNRVTVLPDGQSTFEAMEAAIRSAQRHINLEYYTIEDVVFASGTHLSALLLEKRRAGVAVNILYDGYGSSGTPPDFFTQLETAGAKLFAYHPVATVNPADALTVNNRDHRKILVVDGIVAIVGGVNLSSDYESKSPGSDDDDIAERTEEAAEEQGAGIGETLGLTTQLPAEWRDTALRLEGPAVAQLQRLFLDQWQKEGGEAIDSTGFFPETQARGKELVRIIGSTPNDDIARYYVTLVSSLRNAEERAWISAAYFVPTPDEKEALMEAAERGVDVRLLLAGSSDSETAIAVAQTHYDDLLESGIKIYEAHSVVLHAKAVAVDGVWSAVGSSNFDYRSVLYNDEVDAIILGTETARDLEQVFEQGMALAQPIDLETWEAERTLPERMKGFFARFWENLL